jgi:hypothetical protein
MKTFIHCPKCKKPLVSDYRPLHDTTGYWTKDCITPNHRIYTRTIVGNDSELEDLLITLSNKHLKMAVWEFQAKKLYIRTSDHPNYYLPFFLPDLSDYDKLVEKIKTLMIFG